MRLRRVSILMALVAAVLCFSIGTVLADTPQYENTQAFADVLGYEDVVYDYLGIDESTSVEMISVTFDDVDYDTFSITVLFSNDSTDVSLYAWNLVTVNESQDQLTILQTVNQLNYDYPYGKFYWDATDNSITCDMTVDLTYSSDPGRTVFEGLRILAGLLYDDSVMETLLSLQ